MPNHSVTVTRSLTSTSSSTRSIILNIGFLKDFSGILKLLQLVVGIVCVGISAHYSAYWYVKHQFIFDFRVDFVFTLVAVACLVTTFLLIFSSFISQTTASVLPKTAFEYVFHGTAFFLYLFASVAYVVEMEKRKGYIQEIDYGVKTAAAIMGLINSCLYLLSAIFACHRN